MAHITGGGGEKLYACGERERGWKLVASRGLWLAIAMCETESY